MTSTSILENQALPDPDHLDDLKLAASKMLGAKRRAFQAAMALKYCAGNPRQAEAVFGWSRRTVQLGLHEKHPDVAHALWTLAKSHSQQDPTFHTTLSFTRLTAAEALKQLRARGFAEEVLPSASTMAEVLNRNGYRLRPVLKAKPQKKSPKPTPSSPTSRQRIKPAKGMESRD
jgi:hypothetical protein